MKRSLAAILLLISAVQPYAAQAEDASPWSQSMRSRIRLIAGSNAEGATMRAGVEISLNDGWHTYWRYPGDSGVPPKFDFTGSDNVRDVQVSWPAPLAFNDETGTSIGYKGGVIFPLRITPRDQSKPVTLRLKLDYAVCEKLCVPEDAKTSLAISRSASAFDPALRASEARVPKEMSAAEVGLTAKRVTTGTKPLVFVDVAAPGNTPMEIFAEGPTPQWSLPIPKPAQGAPKDRRHFGFELDGLPPGADPKGKYSLTYTIVSGDRAIEVTAPLD